MSPSVSRKRITALGIGRRVSLARQRAKLSGEQLARLICVSKSIVSQWQNGKRCPSVKNLERIAKALDVPVEDLLYAPEVA